MAFFAGFVEDYTDYKIIEYEDISEYKGEGAKEIKAPAGKVFAGWFIDEDCTKTIGDKSSGKAYAKFVSDDVFGVKWQISDPADAVKEGGNGELAHFRLVSSVDNLKYAKVGFLLKRTSVDGSTTQTAQLSTTTVYEKINGNYGTLTYDPTIFSDSSNYFITAVITNTNWEAWGEAYYTVTTYFETQDGTIVVCDSTYTGTVKNSNGEPVTTFAKCGDSAETFKMSYDNHAINLKANNRLGDISKLSDLALTDAEGNAIYDHVFYVANDGDDTNNGTTIDTPVATVTKAIDLAEAAVADGDSAAILLNRGDIFRVVNHTYVEADNISIGAYGDGAKPKVFGAVDAIEENYSFTSYDAGEVVSPDANDGNLASITVPNDTKLWKINLSDAGSWLDMGAIYFIDDVDGDYGNEKSVIVADKKWNRTWTSSDTYDKLVEAYDFFYHSGTKDLYVLLPEDKAPSAEYFDRIEIPVGDHGFDIGYSASAKNVTICNIDIRYCNYGVAVWGENAQGFTAKGLEIGWIGGARQNTKGNYAKTYVDENGETKNTNFTRCGNGIEIWGGTDAHDFIIDHCYVYECYDAGITFQNSTSDKRRVFRNIQFTDNLLVRNTYNIEYFLHTDPEADNANEYYIKNVLFDGNICRDAGGTEDNLAWGAAYRPDKGVASHIKGGTTTGNNTMLTNNPGVDNWNKNTEANYKLKLEEGDVATEWCSSFEIKNNIFDSAVNTVLGVSSNNEGGEPEFESNLYVQAYGEGFGVSGTNYTAAEFKKDFDSTGDFVARYIATADSVYASARTINTAGGVETEDTDTLANTLYKLQNNASLNVGYIGGSVTSGENSYGKFVNEWLTTYAAETGNTVTVNRTNAGLGGTSSQLGFYRIDEDILKYNPDLVFIEFAINDVYAGVTEENSHLYMEGMIKKIRQADPQTDIVILLIGNDSESYRTGDYPSLNAHKAVAEHYGIPTVNIAAALDEALNTEGAKVNYNGTDYDITWENLFGEDPVHPNEVGHQFYANVITSMLEQKFAALADDELVLADHAMPQVDMVSNNSSASEIVKFSNADGDEKGIEDELTTLVQNGFTVKSYSGYNVNNLGNIFDYVLVGGEGDSFEYTFTGKEFNLWYDNCTNASGAVTLRVTIDDSEIYQTDNRGEQWEWQIANNLSNGRHTIKIEVLSGTDIAIGGFLISK